MTTNNWHVPLDKFSEKQRAIIERVYGSMQININRYFGFYNGLVLFVDVKESLGKEITTDEAFKILGLDRLLDTDLVTVNNLKAQNKALHQDLSETTEDLIETQKQLASVESKLESIESMFVDEDACPLFEPFTAEKLWNYIQKQNAKQLASQPEQGLQDVDWGIVEDKYIYCAQSIEKRKVSFFTPEQWCVYQDRYRLLATRPKPKVKPLTPEQIEAVREFYKDASKAFNEGRSMTAEKWLKERGNE